MPRFGAGSLRRMRARTFAVAPSPRPAAPGSNCGRGRRPERRHCVPPPALYDRRAPHDAGGSIVQQGPQGRRRPAGAVGAAVHAMKIAAGEIARVSAAARRAGDGA